MQSKQQKKHTNQHTKKEIAANYTVRCFIFETAHKKIVQNHKEEEEVEEEAEIYAISCTSRFTNHRQ